MAYLRTGLWRMTTVLMIFSHISASLSSHLERPGRQIELKMMHDAGMRREYEKAAKLLQDLMNYKRSVGFGAEDSSDHTDKSTDGLWSSKEKLIKMKTCLNFVENLDTSVSSNEAKDAMPMQMFSRSVCQLIAEINDATSGATADGNQE